MGLINRLLTATSSCMLGGGSAWTLAPVFSTHTECACSLGEHLDHHRPLHRSVPCLACLRSDWDPRPWVGRFPQNAIDVAQLQRESAQRHRLPVLASNRSRVGAGQPRNETCHVGGDRKASSAVRDRPRAKTRAMAKRTNRCLHRPGDAEVRISPRQACRSSRATHDSTLTQRGFVASHRTEAVVMLFFDSVWSPTLRVTARQITRRPPLASGDRRAAGTAG